MTVTDRTAATAEEFAARIAPFADAPTPPEVAEAAIVEEVARAVWADQYPFDHWDSTQRGQRDHYRRLAAVAVGAYRATQDGGAVRAALTDVAEDLEWAATKQDHPDVAVGFAAAAGRVRERLDDMRDGDGAW